MPCGAPWPSTDIVPLRGDWTQQDPRDHGHCTEDSDTASVPRSIYFLWPNSEHTLGAPAVPATLEATILDAISWI